MALNYGDILVYDGTQWVNQPGIDIGVSYNTFYVDSVNHMVGIGTSLPGQLLTVSGTAAISNLAVASAGPVHSAELSVGTLGTGPISTVWKNPNCGTDQKTLRLSINTNGRFTFERIDDNYSTVMYYFLGLDATNDCVGVGTAFPSFPLHVYGALAYGVPNSAPTDASLGSAQVSAWVNESMNQLTFKVKYSNGTTVKSGTVSLT